MTPKFLLREGVMKEEKRKVALEKERRQQTMPEAESGLDPVLPGRIGQSDGVIFSPNSLGGNRLALNPGFWMRRSGIRHYFFV